jgi:MYXO-CTERM domain-containing protein
MLRSNSVLLSALLAGTIGCAVPPEAQTGRRNQAIINGVVSGIEDDAAVALPLFSAGGSFQGACSGVLVAPNVVLTARHCVSRTESGGIACDEDGNAIAGGGVVSDYKASQISILIGPELPSSLEFPSKGKTVIHTGSDNLCNNDFAIVILDTPLPTAKIAPIRLDGPPVEQEMLLVVGWGQSNNSSGYGRRRRDNVPVEAVGPAYEFSKGLVLGPNEFGVGESICSGDSGGPAFDMKTGAVIGVVSRGGNGAPYDPNSDPAYTPCVDQGQYTTHNIYTRTDTFKALIMQAFAEAGAEPWIEGGPDPRKSKFGEACTTGDTCRSNICLGSMCTDACAGADATTCAEGFTCQDKGGAFVCDVAPPEMKSGGCSVASHAPNGGGWAASLLALLGLAIVRRRRRAAAPIPR